MRARACDARPRAKHPVALIAMRDALSSRGRESRARPLPTSTHPPARTRSLRALKRLPAMGPECGGVRGFAFASVNMCSHAPKNRHHCARHPGTHALLSRARTAARRSQRGAHVCGGRNSIDRPTIRSIRHEIMHHFFDLSVSGSSPESLITIFDRSVTT